MIYRTPNISPITSQNLAHLLSQRGCCQPSERAPRKVFGGFVGSHESSHAIAIYDWTRNMLKMRLKWGLMHIIDLNGMGGHTSHHVPGWCTGANLRKLEYKSEAKGRKPAGATIVCEDWKTSAVLKGKLCLKNRISLVCNKYATSSCIERSACKLKIFLSAQDVHGSVGRKHMLITSDVFLRSW